MPTKSKYGPEIYELCLELYTTERMSYDKIAQYLKDEKGVVARKKNPEDPDKPVDRATILKWMDKAVGDVDKARTRRQRVEERLAADDLDEARRLAYELRDETDPAVAEAKSRALKGFLDVRDARSRTYGTYAPKRKDVSVTTAAGGVHPRDLNPKGEKVIADFEAFLAQGNGARNTDDAG